MHSLYDIQENYAEGKDTMKRLLAALLAIGLYTAPIPAQADSVVPKDIYEWVQSTARQSYYFNKEVMHYGVDADGYINLDEIVVPALHQYDPIQRDDVISKRRWKGLSTDGYEDLYGCAEYLVLNTKEKTVLVRRHEDLDSDWGVITADTSDEGRSYDSLSDKDVDKKFYQAIIDYADAHQKELIEKTKGKLRPEDEKRLQQKDKDKKDTTTKDKKAREKKKG